MIKQIFNFIFIFFVKTIRPLLGPENCCRYYIACTNYAKIQLTNENFLIALYKISKRVLSCNPFFYNPYFEEV